MLSYLFAGLVFLSVVCGALTGRMEAVSSAALSGAADAVQLLIALGGMMILWSGLMELCERSGLISVFSRAVRPILWLLFPDLRKDRKAQDAIAMNMAANVLGLSNAATPLGLRAMAELKRAAGGGDTASRAMSMFVVMNTASIQLIPTTVAALRAAAGAENPFDILPAIWITSILALTVGTAALGIMERLHRRHGAGKRGAAV